MNRPDNSMNRPDNSSNEDRSKLIDRHLAGMLDPQEVERLEQKLRSSPVWAQAYREAEELARVLREGLGGGATAPTAVKHAIRRRVNASAPLPATANGRRDAGHGVAWNRRWGRRHVLSVAAAVLIAVGAFALWPRDPLLPAGFPEEPLALKDLARLSTVAFEAETELRDGRIRVRPREVLYGTVADRAIVVPAALPAGQRVVFFGRYDDKGMIHAVSGMRGVVHLSGVQRWEGKDRSPRDTRALALQANQQRSLTETLQDIEAFLRSDTSLVGDRAGLLFSADVAARYLGAFEFEAILKPLVQLVLNGDKDPRARDAAAHGLAASDRGRACEVLLSAMSKAQLAMIQAESEDGHVLLGCLAMIQSSADARLAPVLRRVAASFQAPTLRRAAAVALAAVSGTGPANGTVGRSARAPRRFDVDGQTCVSMSGIDGQCKGLLAVFRGDASISAFRPIVQRAIARGFGVLIVPPGIQDFSACLARSHGEGAPCQSPLRVVAHGSAHAQARDVGGADGVDGAGGAGAPVRSLLMPSDTDVMAFVATSADRLAELLAD